MVASPTSRPLSWLENSQAASMVCGRRVAPAGDCMGERMEMDGKVLQPFLRIPPFPGCKADAFATVGFGAGQGLRTDDLIGRVRELRVGGCYWGAQPSLPKQYVLVTSSGALDASGSVFAGCPRVLWAKVPEPSRNCFAITGECDPWHMLAGASALFDEQAGELCFIAGILNIPVYLKSVTSGRFELQGSSSHWLRHETAFLNASIVNPFTNEAMSVPEAVELCGFWRALIDSNRDLAGGVGFAFWKQRNVAPLLWGGSRPFEFLGSVDGLGSDRPVAVWRSKAPAAELARLEESGVPIVEVEDGFLRSQGLGADCVPPLSITVDRLGAYFDPAQPSELEKLLQDGAFDEQLLERARELRSLIVASGLGKYERGGLKLERPAGERWHILVPGQVEDDRSVMTGGSGLSNLELLRRVRQEAPDAYILYKPHPDVVAGHRKGAIPDRTCRELADEIVGDLPISSLIEMVDEVHVNTSLAGFEALMREKAVTAYGVPFYAGWGLTRDKGPVPRRRTARRTLDELVAAALLLYPRYLDPVTGLPCPAEVVVDRLTSGAARADGPVVVLRRLQGKLMRRLRSVLA